MPESRRLISSASLTVSVASQQLTAESSYGGIPGQGSLYTVVITTSGGCLLFSFHIQKPGPAIKLVYNRWHDNYIVEGKPTIILLFRDVDKQLSPLPKIRTNRN